jgi:hypothetical protein
MQPAAEQKQDAEWVALRAAHANWGDDAPRYVQIAGDTGVRFVADAGDVQSALELLLKSFVPENPERKHLTIEAHNGEVCFTVSDSLWPLTDEGAVDTQLNEKHDLGSWVPKLEHRWFAIRHADAMARKHGGRLSLKESNGHLAVTLHLVKG